MMMWLRKRGLATAVFAVALSQTSMARCRHEAAALVAEVLTYQRVGWLAVRNAAVDSPERTHVQQIDFILRTTLLSDKKVQAMIDASSRVARAAAGAQKAGAINRRAIYDPVLAHVVTHHLDQSKPYAELIIRSWTALADVHHLSGFPLPVQATLAPALESLSKRLSDYSKCKPDTSPKGARAK